MSEVVRMARLGDFMHRLQLQFRTAEGLLESLVGQNRVDVGLRLKGDYLRMIRSHRRSYGYPCTRQPIADLVHRFGNGESLSQT